MLEKCIEINYFVAILGNFSSPLYKTAQDMENMSDDDGWEFVSIGDQQSFGIKTAGLEEKATACQMLVSNRTVLVVLVNQI